MIKSFLSFTDDEIVFVFDNNPITITQKKIFKELVDVLDDFTTATTMIQTDSCSIGYVLPLLRGISYELNNLNRLQYYDKMRLDLLESINRRFSFVKQILFLLMQLC